MNRKQKTRSPLKEKPLRNPGQSADEALQDLLSDKIVFPGIYLLILVALTFMDWQRYWRPLDKPPILSTVVLAFVAVVILAKISSAMKKFNAYKLGREGEKTVGQELERLRKQGFEVFHDILGPGFNVDHLLISTKGIYAIETKTWSKPLTGDNQIRFDGERIFKMGKVVKPNPADQATWNAKWINELLRRSTGKSFGVKPVVVFPGWYVDNSKITLRPNVWVLNPSGLEGFLAKSKETLSEEDANLAAFHIERYVRAGFATN